MADPILLINGERKVALDRGLITIGRAADNVIAFTDDSNVSRYHAEIENRGDGDYWIFDLNSSNGTTLNGEPLTVEKPLFDGDKIWIGGSQSIEVVLSDREAPAREPEEEQEPEVVAEPEAEEAPSAAPEQQAKKFPLIYIVAGLALLVALFAVGIAVIIYALSGSGFGGSCEATAKIAKPLNGDILSDPTAIEIELDDPNECVAKAVYTIDGEAVASADKPPFTATIDPNQFPGLSDGLDHYLKVVLIDSKGNEVPQPAEVALNFDTLVTETPPPTPEIPTNGGGGGGGQPQQQAPQVSLTDTKSMTDRIIPRFSGQASYVTGNPEFLNAVAGLTTDYVEPGFYQRALKYRDVINTEFIQERGLDPPLGYLLAMARSKFQPTNDPKGAGLWRMDNQLVLAFKYNGTCGTETIASESQDCAAIAASSYLKDMILKAFGGNSGDIIYVIAAFGMRPIDAAKWRQTLPEDRKDFWSVLANDPQKQDAVARFFAASIVAENPARFGLQDDKPLSTLYSAELPGKAPPAEN